MELIRASGPGVPTPSSLLPSIERLLEALPEIQLRDLPEDCRNCNICMEAFTGDADTEQPVSLGCGHIFGSFCIKAWVSSSQVSQSCPLCRTALTSGSSIARWEHFATIMQQEPYTSMSQTLWRTGTSISKQYDSAVELVSLFYQVVMEILAHHRRRRIPASDLLIQSAQAVAKRMGCLYVLLKPTMDAMGVSVSWNECGPNVSRILNSKFEGTFKQAFESMAQVERMVTP